MKPRKATQKNLAAVGVLDRALFMDNIAPVYWNEGRTKVITTDDDCVLAYGHLIDGFIDRIGVHEGWQRQGLGTQILKSLISAARRQHLTRVFTYIHRANVSSLLTFLKAEFRTVGPVGKATWIKMERLI